MKIIVCGGRNFNDVDLLCQALDAACRSYSITEIIEGGARGADYLAGFWADKKGLKHTVVMADWDKHGKAAGPIRNQQMLDLKPDAVMAFPGGKGTEHMTHIATKAGIPVWRIEP